MRGEKIYRKPSRREESTPSKSRNLGVFLLMLALFLFQLTLFVMEKLFPQSQEVVQAELSPSVGQAPSVGQTPSVGQRTFFFDPNTITKDSLCMLGLSPAQAQTIINYRAKGGRFRRPEDFSRMYVVSDEFFQRVLPYIEIPEEVLVTKKPKAPLEDSLRVKKGQNVPKHPSGSNLGIKRASNVPKVERLEAVEEKERDKGRFMVELNSADSAALVRLYGIGPYYAKKIMEYRARLGGFYAVEQLLEIRGIDSLRFAGFERSVTVDPSHIRCFRLDTAARELLLRHPYVGAYAARGILLLREKLGKKACTLENLVKERVLTRERAELLWPYILPSEN